MICANVKVSEIIRPHLFYHDADGALMEGLDDEGALKSACDCIKLGRVVAVKDLGGFHLCCRIDDEELVKSLRKRKHRDAKPFAVMCKDLAAARRFCEISEAEESVLCGTVKPIVLLKKKDKSALCHISENSRLGVMLPYTPLHHLIFDGLGDIDSLVMTSANLSDRPIICKNDEALTDLFGIADGFLLNDRDIQMRCDDSVLWVIDGKEYYVRRSRGYVPFPLTLNADAGAILACGAEQKASFCLSKGCHVFPSQHIGDLKNLETLENYEEQIARFEKLFDIKPELIACDLHPDYMSGEYAEEKAKAEGLPLVRVQHHHAHMASCMADNGIDEACMGVIWDGSGYGSDGSVWGGEFLAGDAAGFERLGRIAHIRLPGGDRAVKEIDRLALSLLLDAGLDTSLLHFDPAYAAQIERQLSAGINCPKASSMGRLFDGVAAILGIKHTASYEGQGAVLLESEAEEGIEDSYPVSIAEQDGMFIFEYAPMLSALLSDLKGGKSRGECAARFMNTLVAMAAEMCVRIREKTGLAKLMLSGGSFQNIYVLSRLMRVLKEQGFEPYCHRRVSCNDEGISLGQINVAAHSSEFSRLRKIQEEE